MDKIKELIFGVLLKRFGMKYLVQGYKLLDGYKTQIGMAGAGIIFALQAFGQITADEANAAYAIVATWTGQSFIEKLKKHETMASEIASQVKVEGGSSGTSSSEPSSK